MGGKSSTSTQQVSIPPEVLARYNSVNATAEQAASQPFQAYNGEFVAPLSSTQQAGIANTNSAAGQAQPYYQAATNTLMGAQQSTSPYYQAATQALMSGMGQGAAGTQGAYGSVYGANAAAQPFQQAGAYNMGAAYAGAQPYNAAALQEYGAGLAAAQPFNQQAAQGINQAYQGAQPYNAMATGLAGAGAQGVNAQQIGGQQIGQFMSPYIQSVLQGTEGMLNQQNQQAMSGQTGNAIMSGAFGGDRAGIAAANLAQQQQLANAQTYSGILNQGYGQALGAAQQQQGVNLGAAQANRAALQQASGQMLGIGQQGYAQGLGAAQQQAALGQQLFGQGQTAGQNLAALGQQKYGQGMGLASGQTGLGQQLFAQGMTNAQQQAALAQQQYAQGLGGSSALASLGQGIYGTGAQTAQQLAALGTGAQGASLQGAQAQLAAGQQQQQTQQAQDQALQNQFLQQQSYPFQTAQFLANIAEGTGSLSGSTTTTTQPGGFFSDERLKENIKPIGKTNDGQTIYSYNYKGDHRTQIGLLAQEVEKHHPEAVGESHGYKTVDYGKATDHAAERGHFAFGGSPGFDPALANEMLQAQQGFYGGVAGPAGGGGGPYGGLGRVPQAQPGNYVLHPASGNIEKPKTAAKTINENTDAAKNLYAMGKGAKGLYDKFTAAPDVPMPTATVSSYDAPTMPNVSSDDVTPMPNLSSYAPKADDAGADLTELSDLFARGGLAGARGYADGGMPYSGGGLDIPDDNQKYSLQTAQGKIDKPESGMQQVGDAAKTATEVAALFALKRGGRVGFADGGYKDGGRAQRAAGGLAGRQHFEDGGAPQHAWPTGTIEDQGDGHKAWNPWGPDRPPNIDLVAAAKNLIKNTVGAPVTAGTTMGGALGHAAARDPAWRPFQGTFGGGDSSATTGDQNGVKIPIADTMANAPQKWKDAIARDRASGKGHGLGSPSVAAPPPADVGTPISVATPPTDLGTLAPAPSQPNITGGTPAKYEPEPGIMSRIASGLGSGVKDYASGLANGEEQNWVPLLAGLAAMGTAPTRSLGVALASGLGAGAEAYPALQTQQAKLQKQQLKNQQTVNDQYRKGYSLKEDPSGTVLIAGRRYTPILNGTGFQSASGAPVTPGAAQKSYLAWSNLTDSERRSNEVEQQKVYDGYNASLRDRPVSNSLIHAVTDAPDDNQKGVGALVNQGPLAAVFAPLVAKANQAAAALGLKNPDGTPLQINQEDLTNRTAIDKIARIRASGGAQSVEDLDARLHSMPSSELLKPTNIHLVATQLVQQQQPINRYNVHSEFGRQNGMPMSPTGYRTQDADSAYQAKYRPEDYAADQSALEQAMNDHNFPNIMKDIESGDPQRVQRARALLDRVRPGISQYLLSGGK